MPILDSQFYNLYANTRGGGIPLGNPHLPLILITTYQDRCSYRSKPRVRCILASHTSIRLIIRHPQETPTHATPR